jgi:penicillin G amidase
VTESADMLREKAKASLPPLDGEVRVAGLAEPVEILWDRWGVPHIYAQSTHDLYFAQGYVLASERLFQMEFFLRLGSGRLAELFSELALPMDRFIRTVGWNRAGKSIADQWDDLSWEMASAFSDGVRAWGDRMPARPLEYDILDLDPLLAEPREMAEMAAAAGVFMAWSLSTNWDAELLRAEIAERFGWEAMTTLFPDLPTEASGVFAGHDGGPAGRRRAFDLLREAPVLPKGQGSNNWVVGGSRSTTGMPLLANDPHLQVMLPSIWYEMHLSAPGIDVRGVSLPFSPGVIIGHNERIAWGFTNVGGDTQDLYLEQLNDEGTAALYLGEWEPLAVHREEIGVRGREEPEVLEVRETRHGPLLDSYMIGVASPEVVAGGITKTYALRFVGLEEGVKLSTVHQLDTASHFDEFRAAGSGWVCPGQNFIYADIDGNIGYQCTGLHPIRRAGDGTIPVPGWTDEYEWDGFVPFEELPWAFNPEQGYLVTANNKPHDDSYPHLLGKDFIPPFRARRIAHLLTATDRHDRDSFARIHIDTFSIPATEIVPHLYLLEPESDRQKGALGLLAEWDFDLAEGSAAAAIYEVWAVKIAEAVLKPKLGGELFQHYYGRRQWTNSFLYQVLPNLLAYPTAAWWGGDGQEARDRVLRQTLDAALDELTGVMGDDMAAWAWGRIHRVRFAGALALIPDLAELFTAAEGPLGGDEQTVLQGMYEPGAGYGAVIVPSWRQVIDLSDLDASVGTHTVGQSGNPASPHFNDLYPLWSKGEYHPLPFTRAAVEAAAESTLTLVPE